MSALTFSLRDWQKAAIVKVCKASSKHEDDEAADADATRLLGDDGALAALSSWSDDWKVLVYDKDTKRTLSPLFTVAELRALGVTLHMAIDSPRDSISDVSAVYLIRPSPANIRHLVDDAAVGRYRDLSVHFTSPVPRPLLDAFARGCVESGAVLRVAKVVDHFLSYVATEPRLLTLGMSDSYAAYAHPSCTEATVQAYCKAVADGIFSAFATIGVVPILMASREGPSELVARLLDAQFRDHLAAGGGGLFAKNHLLGGGVGAGAGGGGYGLDGGAGGAEAVAWLSIPGHVRRSLVPLGWNGAGRPVCLLVDRGLDLAAPLLHASSYGSLVEDTLGPARDGQRIVVPEGEPVREEMSLAGDAGEGAAGSATGGGALLGGLWEWASAAAGVKKAGAGAGGRGEKAGRQLTLDTDADSFWSRWAPAPFPEAIEAHEQELQVVIARENEIRATAGAAGLADAMAGVALDGSGGGAGDRPSDLSTAMDSLPTLLKRKKVLETHAHLLQAVMSRVAARTLPHFNEWETASGGGAGSGGYAAGSGLDRKLVMAVVGDAEKGAFADRLRLAAIHLLLCNPLAGAAGAGGGPAQSASSAASAFIQGMHEEAAALLQGLRASLVPGFALAAAGGAGGAAGGAASPEAHTALQPAAEAAYGVAVAALTYIKKLRTQPGAGGSGLGVGGGGAAGLGGAVGSLAQKIGLPSSTTGGKFLSALTNTTAALLNKATTSVQRALQGEVRMPVTRVVQAVCEGKPSAAPSFVNLESFLVLDPRAGGPGGGGAGAAAAREKTYGAYLAAAQGGAGSSSGVGGSGGAGSASATMAALGSSLSSPATFRSAFVFMVGGGCHAEYHDVLSYAAASGSGAEGEGKSSGSVAGLAGAPAGRTIVYGATEMAHPDAFLRQLASLSSGSA